MRRGDDSNQQARSLIDQMSPSSIKRLTSALALALFKSEIVFTSDSESKCTELTEQPSVQYGLLDSASPSPAKRRKIKSSDYPCDLCPSTFSRERNLRKHKLKHAGEIPMWICTEEGCDTKYSDDANLRRHRREVHKNIPRIYCKNKCGYSSQRLENVKRHETVPGRCKRALTPRHSTNLKAPIIEIVRSTIQNDGKTCYC